MFRVTGSAGRALAAYYSTVTSNLHKWLQTLPPDFTQEHSLSPRIPHIATDRVYAYSPVERWLDAKLP